MNTVVTGGAGFIGSHLVDALVDGGHEVTVVDNMSGGRAENLNPAAAFIYGDANDPEVMEMACRGAECVFHLAAVASVPGSIKDPISCHKSGLLATATTIEEARKAGVRRFVFTSSSAVYGNWPVHCRHESVPPASSTPYGASKAAGEQYVMAYAASFGMEAVCLRYFNVYGPRQSNTSSYSGVIAAFCGALARKERPIIYGDGSQQRDYVYVGDVVQANLAAMNAAGKKLVGVPVNISTGYPTSVLDLWTTLKALCPTSLEPRFEKERAGDIQCSYAIPILAREILGWSARVHLYQGLAETARFYGLDVRDRDATV